MLLPVLFIILSFSFLFFFFSPPPGRREKELPRRYAVTRSSSAACKNIQYPLVRQLVKYCARPVFRYAFRETNLPRTCYSGFHGIFDRDGDCAFASPLETAKRRPRRESINYGEKKPRRRAF